MAAVLQNIFTGDDADEDAPIINHWHKVLVERQIKNILNIG